MTTRNITTSSISIIIITHNSKCTIKDCILSLLRSKSSKRHRIIVIDNASRDNTTEIIRKKFSINIDLVINKTNKGFAKAVNQGLKYTTGDVLLLNPDTVCQDDLVEKLKKVAAQTSSSIIAPQVLNPDGTLQPSCGNFPTALNTFLDKIPVISNILPVSELIRVPSYYRKQRSPDWVSGVCLYITKQALSLVGGFDEHFFLYVEDIEWCYRAKKKGVRILYTPTIFVTHYNEGKKKDKYPEKFFRMREGFLLFFLKHRKNEAATFKQLLQIEMKLRSHWFSFGKPLPDEIHQKCRELLRKGMFKI